MWRWSVIPLALIGSAFAPTHRSLPPLTAADDSLTGRWDISIRTPDGERPSWLELERSGRDAMIGRLVGIVGSARPISSVTVQQPGDSFHFEIPHQWENGDGDLTVEGRMTNGRLAGMMTFPDGKQFAWTGVRAPLLHRDKAPQWGAPITLLHQNDLGGWRAVGGTNQWVVSNGVLRSPHSGANIQTERTFSDFKLHIEFRYP